MCLKWLTFHQRGWHRGWCGCCPCPPGSALVRRKSVVCLEWRTAVSPGWCPGGLGSPRTGRWCDRLPGDSSLDPCSPGGRLTRSKKMPSTLYKVDSLRHYSFWLLLDSVSIALLYMIHPEMHFNTTSAAPGFSISNLHEIKTDATKCSLLYWSGSLDPLYPLLSGTQLSIKVTKINPAVRSQSNPQQRLSWTVRAL